MPWRGISRHGAPSTRRVKNHEPRGTAPPRDLDALVKGVAPQREGVEVHAASLLAIEVDTPAEKECMARLATALNLPQPLVEHVRAAVGMKPGAV